MMKDMPLTADYSKLHDEQRQRNVATSLWCETSKHVTFRREPLHPVEQGMALVKTLFTGISRGTEATVLQGLVPESEHERMRGPHMGGEFPFPVKYGYCAVGQVQEGPADILGQTVFCLHPHQNLFVVPTVDLIPLPAELPPERGVLAANMETALNIVWDASILPGERVAVFGAGVVGTLVAFLASKIAGVDLVLVDPDLERASLASSLGIAFTSPNGLEGEFDCLINASGASAALSQAIDLAGFEARIVEASWYGQRQVSLSLGGAFHSKRLSLVSSQVGHVAKVQRARWSYRRRLEKAMQLLCEPSLDILISGESQFSDLPQDYARILTTTSTLCHRVRY